MRALFAAVAGLIFGVGLTISEMVNPAKVLAFLDVFSGAWDPSLMFVMGAGVLVYAVGYQLIIRRNAPSWSPRSACPARPKSTRHCSVARSCSAPAGVWSGCARVLHSRRWVWAARRF